MQEEEQNDEIKEINKKQAIEIQQLEAVINELKNETNINEQQKTMTGFTSQPQKPSKKYSTPPKMIN